MHCLVLLPTTQLNDNCVSIASPPEAFLTSSIPCLCLGLTFNLSPLVLFSAQLESFQLEHSLIAIQDPIYNPWLVRGS